MNLRQFHLEDYDSGTCCSQQQRPFSEGYSLSGV